MSPGKDVQSAAAAEPPPPPPPPRHLSHRVRALLSVLRNWPLLLKKENAQSLVIQSLFLNNINFFMYHHPMCIVIIGESDILIKLIGLHACSFIEYTYEILNYNKNTQFDV